MTHGSLFSGVGGFDYAAELIGWQNVFHCEWIEYKRKFLECKFKNTISYGDISTTDFNIHRGHIDVLTGGFPCQDASIAKQDGKGQQGLRGERTGLLFEMVRAIREIRPRFVVAENVSNFLKINGGQTLAQFSPNYPQWGTMQNGEFAERQKSVPPIIAPGCIWLLTPAASDYRRYNLSFPYFSKRHHRSPGNLPEHLYRLTGGAFGRVNHQFYAWMMGYPINWLHNTCTDTETQ